LLVVWLQLNVSGFQLQTFLQRARSDRFFALWVLEATSGMRRCELAGARRDLLDLDAGTLAIETTRVVVDGRVIESDGKTANAQHVLALDPFTLAALKMHVEKLDRERRELGPDYHDHGVLFCWKTAGRRIPTRSPGASSSWPRRLAYRKSICHDVRHILSALFPCRDSRHRSASGPAVCAVRLPLPRCRLSLNHVRRVSLQQGRPTATRVPPNTASADRRHSYATAGRDAKIDWKALSKRIGHADVAFTMKQYVQTDLEADRQVANTLAELIIGGSLISIDIADDMGEGAA